MIASCPELSMLDATSGFYAEGSGWRCLQEARPGPSPKVWRGRYVHAVCDAEQVTE